MEKIYGRLKDRKTKIHFIGVGGVGMSSLFLLSAELGFSVSGSDSKKNDIVKALLTRGFDIGTGHNKERVKGKDLVVYTLALSEGDPELIFAESLGIPTVSRAEYQGALMQFFSTRIGISGTHGKSTTTAMTYDIFERAGLDPTLLLGAKMPKTDSTFKLGGRDILIYEACEYKDSFLFFSPTVATFTNLEHDHIDYFKSFLDLKASFIKAMNMPSVAVININDENLRELLPYVSTRRLTYGFNVDADVRGVIKKSDKGRYEIEVHHGNGEHFGIALAVLGRFNAENALAAAATALSLGVSPEHIRSALESFCGIERRQEKIGFFQDIPVYYDYAHHPTEIACTIDAVKEMTGERVAVIFKPHTYSRTAGLMNEFARALSSADELLLCDIDGIRENKIDGVTSERLAELVGKNARRINEEDILECLSTDGIGAIIIMGAADLDNVRGKLLGK